MGFPEVPPRITKSMNLIGVMVEVRHKRFKLISQYYSGGKNSMNKEK